MMATPSMQTCCSQQVKQWRSRTSLSVLPRLLLAQSYAVCCAGTGGGGAGSVLVQQQQEQIQQVGALLHPSPAFPQLEGMLLHIADHTVCLCHRSCKPR